MSIPLVRASTSSHTQTETQMISRAQISEMDSAHLCSLIHQNMTCKKSKEAFQLFQGGLKEKILTGFHTVKYEQDLYDLLVQQNLLKEALKVFKVMRKNNRKDIGSLYENLIKKLYVSKPGESEDSRYKWIIKEFAGIRDGQGADVAFYKLRALKKLDLESYNLMLRAYAREVKFVNVKAAKANFSRAQIVVNETKTAINETAGEVFKREKAQKKLFWAQRNLSCAEKRLWKIERRMHDAVYWMKEQNIAANIETHNSFIEFNNRAEKPEEALKIFHRVKDEKSPALRPNSATYYSLINLYKKRGELEKARALLMEMVRAPESEIPLEAYKKGKLLTKGFSVILDTYKVKIRDSLEIDKKSEFLKAMEEIFAEMKQQNIECTVVTYSVMIESCARVGRKDRVEELIKEMIGKGLDPTSCYNVLVSFYVSIGDRAIAEEIYKRSGIQPKIQKGKNGIDEIDFHSCTHVTAHMQLLNYIKNKKPEKPFIIIPGKGKHSKRQDYTMRDYFLKVEIEGYVIGEISGNLGILIVEKKKVS